MGTTRFSGPILGDARSGGGIYSGYPIALASLPTIRVWFEDFEHIPRIASGPVVANDSTASFLQTVDIGSPTNATTAIAGGLLSINSGVGDDTGRHAFIVGSTASVGGTSVTQPIANLTNRNFMLETRVALGNFTPGNAFFIGFGTSGTASLTTANALNGADLLGFHITVPTSGVGTINLVARTNSTTRFNQTIAPITFTALATNSAIRLGLQIGADTTPPIRGYVNGVFAGGGTTATTSAANMAPAFTALATEALGGSVLQVDYMLLAHRRT